MHKQERQKENRNKEMSETPNSSSHCIIYLFINYNKITNYIPVVSQARISGRYRTHDTLADSLEHYTLDYQGTKICWKLND